MVSTAPIMVRKFSLGDLDMPAGRMATSRQALSAGCSSSGVGHGPVLVIEDDPVVSLVLSEILVAHGISVISAKSGQDALAVFDQSGLEILVVVMDYAVPGMHAGQIVERLRDINSSVRVVLASGYSRGDISVELDLDEVDAFISKPFPPKALVEAVYELMNLAETRQPH